MHAHVYTISYLRRTANIFYDFLNNCRPHWAPLQLSGPVTYCIARHLHLTRNSHSLQLYASKDHIPSDAGPGPGGGEGEGIGEEAAAGIGDSPPPDTA